MINWYVMAALVAGAHAPDPKALVDLGARVMGGPTSLASIRTIRLAGIQHEFLLGNAERADGPWRTLYSRFTELRQPDANRMRRTGQALSAGTPSSVIVVDDTALALVIGSGQRGGPAAAYEDALDRLNASPERALVLAAAAPALRWVAATHRYGLTFDVVDLPWRNGRMRIELERETHLPTAVEIVRAYPRDLRRAPFGDITLRFEYVDWTAQPSGIWWPMQHKVSLNGEPLRDVTIDTVTVSDAAAPRDSFAILDSARAQFIANLKLAPDAFTLGANGPPTELVPGVVRVPDLWSMTIVKQDDGVVLFEAHLSARYLHEVLDEAHRRYPGAPITGLVMTSDPWAHLGGVREAMALGIPIYVNARSVPFLTALAKSPHTLDPDALQRTPRAPRFIPITSRVTIGAGANRIELYPVGGPYGERMVMAYFPAHRLLYGADLVFTDARYAVTPAIDLRRAVEREHLAVDSVFCVQRSGPVAWSQIVDRARL
jgi:hypothetical protein